MTGRAVYQASGSEWWPLALIGVLIVGGLFSYLMLMSAHRREVALLQNVIARQDREIEDWKDRAWQAAGMAQFAVGLGERVATVAETKQTLATRRRLIRSALLDAFPTRGKLAQLFQFELDGNLAEIAPEGQDLTEQVAAIVSWAESNGQTENLIVAAKRANPGNPLLRELAA